MRLGPKSLLVLKMLAEAGVDVFAWSMAPTRALVAPCGYDSDDDLRRQLSRMSDGGWIERSRTENGEWVLRLTQRGLEAINPEIDPEKLWSEPWQGDWQIITFDLPAHARSLRRQLDLWLRRHRFGGLQGSVWISPRIESSWLDELKKTKLRPSDVSFLVGRPSALSTDADFVANAWNFDTINKDYQAYISTLPQLASLEPAQRLEQESKLWIQTTARDPFLPSPLLPKGYLGRKAAAQRQRFLSNL